jgi:hypothetical protein
MDKLKKSELIEVSLCLWGSLSKLVLTLMFLLIFYVKPFVQSSHQF